MYNFLKFLHLLFVISWMAGVFYLPRIILHYKLALVQKQSTERLTIMARKLFKFSIFTGIIALFSGLLLGTYIYYWRGGWLYLKVLVVAIFWGYFLFTGLQALKMPENEVFGSSFFWRLYNELALVFLVIILFLVLYRPF